MPDIAEPSSTGADGRSDIEISYKKTREVDREGWFGASMRWVGEHPIPAGLVGGLAVVAIAAASAPGAIAVAPLQTGVLSLMVVVAWVVLIYLIRDFFARQATRDVADYYELEADEERFVLTKDDEPEVDIDDPAYEMYLPPDVTPSEDRPQNATPIWLAVEGDGDRHVIETLVTAEEAAEYAEPEDIEEADDELPIHLASGLLQLAARR